MLVVLTAALIGACGSSQDTAAVTSESLVVPSTLPLVADDAPPIAPESSIASSTLPPSDDTDSALLPTEQDVCSWLFSATFRNDSTTLWLEHRTAIEVSSEDWVDSQWVSCEQNQLVQDEDSYDYGFVLSLSGDELIAESNEQGTLVATEWVTLEQAGIQPQLGDFDESSPEAAGLAVIEAALNGQLLDESLFADEILNLEAVSRDHEQLVFLTEEAFEIFGNDPDFEQEFPEYSMEIYFANHAPRTQTLVEYAQLSEWTEATAEVLRTRYPDQEMVFFLGDERKPDGGEYLPVSMRRLLLIETAEGWKVLSFS